MDDREWTRIETKISKGENEITMITRTMIIE